MGGSIPEMPNFRGAGPRILRWGVAILVVLLLLWSTTSIPTGNVGVLTLFGRVTGETLGEGIHLINPLKSVQKLSVQTQSVKESANVPSNEGLILALDTSLLFRLDKSKAAFVFQTVGDNYAEKIVEPTLRAAIRASTSAHSANALYTNARELVQLQIQDELTAQLSPRGVIVENVLLRDVQLPAMLKGSIEAKQQAEQDALRMSFILQKEKQEAERIEAQGIADFQKIVAQGISVPNCSNGKASKPPKSWQPASTLRSSSSAIRKTVCPWSSSRSSRVFARQPDSVGTKLSCSKSECGSEQRSAEREVDQGKVIRLPKLNSTVGNVCTPRPHALHNSSTIAAWMPIREMSADLLVRIPGRVAKSLRENANESVGRQDHGLRLEELRLRRSGGRCLGRFLPSW
jgi:regulator of protease activity HflC (stomatin/prohibitin superfamily)